MTHDSPDDSGIQTAIDRRRYLKATTGALTIGGLAGCLGSLGGGGGESGPITIGAISPLSGGFSPWAVDHRQGLEFGRDVVNEAGGINGRDVELVFRDTEANPQEANTQARELVEQEDAVALTGPVSSDVGIRTGQTAESLEVPLYLHMAGSPAILTPDSRYTFRMSDPPPQMQMVGITQMIEEKGFSSVGAMIADYAWGRAVQSTLQELDKDFDLTMKVAPLSTSDFTPFLKQMPDDLEAMITVGFPSGATTIVKQEFQLGMELEIYGLGGGWAPPRLWWGGMGETAVGNIVEMSTTSPEQQPFTDVAQSYNEQTGNRFSPNKAYGYATIKQIKVAAEELGSASPADIAEGTRQVAMEEIYPQPLEHTEWGELANQSIVTLGFDTGAPSYYPDGEWKITENFVSDPIDPYEPSG